MTYRQVELWDAVAARSVGKLKIGEGKNAARMGWALPLKDGHRVVVGAEEDFTTKDRSMFVWDADIAGSDKIDRSWGRLDGPFGNATLAPDGVRLAVHSYTYTQVFSLRNRPDGFKVADGRCESMAFFPDGKIHGDRRQGNGPFLRSGDRDRS